jgi:hypothetical protein
MTKNEGRFLPRPATAALVGLLVTISLATAQPTRITQPLDASKSTVLIGNRNSQARPEDDRGPVDLLRRIGGMTLVLKSSASQAADLEQFLRQQRAPSSPSFHQWLTAEQYADRFGVSPQDLEKVTAWLESQGLRVDYVARARNWILFSGSAGHVEKAFHTPLHRFNVGGKQHFANSVDPSIPAAFDSVVSLIRGLDDFRTQPRNIPIANFTQGGGHFLVPGDLAVIYDIQPLYQRGITGAGQKVAVVGQTDIQLSDIEHFRAEYSMPVNDPTLVLVTGSSDPGTSTDDLIESDLDLEYAGGIAPNADILFVYSTDVWTSIAFAIDQDLAPVISSSYGYCEPQISSAPASTAAYFQSLAQQGNAKGITWVASSGDTGAADCDLTSEQSATEGLAVDLPASIPEVTGVGGTDFAEGSGVYWATTNNANGSSALSYIPEITWNDTASLGSLLASGGGASIFFAKPVWQTGAGVPADNARDVPDIAFAAAVAHDPYQIYTSGAALYVGGTSAPAPVFAGMLALLNQYLEPSGGQSASGLGNINPVLYGLAQSTPGIFHDITQGGNVVPCVLRTPNCASGEFGYEAGVRYDQATGLGSLDVYNFVVAWADGQLISTTTSLASVTSAQSGGGSTILTATVNAASGGASPSGIVTFTIGQTALGTAALSVSAAGDTAVLTIAASQLAAGANLITATYGGSDMFSASSATLSIVVGSVTVAAVSVAPNLGSGSSQIFALQYSDTGGAASLGQVWVYFNVTLANPAANACMAYYNAATHQINLLSDNGTVFQPATVGTATTLQNSQCALNVAATTVALSSNTLTLDLALTFKPAFAGTKNVYMQAVDISGTKSGWQPLGAWTIAVASGTPSSVSVTPASGSGINQNFTLQYSNTAGAASLEQAWVYFNPTLANPATGTCILYYNAPTGQINLLNDTATLWQPAALGTATILQNSQCSLNVAAATVALSGNALTLNLPMTFKPAYAGAKNIYLHAVDISGSNSGWQALGAWTVAVNAGTPGVIAATPIAGFGASETFQLQYTDAAGAADLRQVWVYINATLANPASNACMLYYSPATRQINLLNDSATAWLTATLGSATTLGNSQCSLNVGVATASLNGNILMLTVTLTFEPAFAGTHNIYLHAVDMSGAIASWQVLGTWVSPLVGIEVRPPPPV